MFLGSIVILREKKARTLEALDLPEIRWKFQTLRQFLPVHLQDFVSSFQMRFGCLQIQTDHPFTNLAFEAFRRVLFEEVALAVESQGLVTKVTMRDSEAGRRRKVFFLGEIRN